MAEPRVIRVPLSELGTAEAMIGEQVIEELQAEIDRLREALEEISRGEGPFSRDRLTHAENTIEAMVRIATDALNGGSRQ